MDTQKRNLHATTVFFEDKGLLILGPPGSGKSDLALRLIDQGGILVADDRCELEVGSKGELTASAPENLKGLLEVRGLGLVKIPARARCSIDIVVQLVRNSNDVVRMPEARSYTLLDRKIPAIEIWPFAGSTVPLIKLALSKLAL